MRTIRHRVRVLPGGRIEITDPSFEAGTEAEVVVTVPEASGDGAPPVPGAPLPATVPRLQMEVGEDGLAVPAPRDPNRPRLNLVDLIGVAPTGRTAEEVDRELRELRDEWDRGEFDV